MISPSFVALHIGHHVTLIEYLVRVLMFLIAFIGIGVTVFWAVRVIEIAQTEINGRGGTNESEP